MTWEYFDRCLEFAAEVGALAMTYHNGGATWGFLRSQEVAWQYNLDYAMHNIGRAQELDMPVGFEAGACDFLKYVCDRVEGWGINLDIGHAYMNAKTDEGFMKYIDEMGDRIVEIHHNGVNQYWGGFMEHQPPHLNNTIDFVGVYSRLRDIECSGPIVCEIQGHDIAQVIKHCQESKEMITGIWNGDIEFAERWNLKAD